MLKTIKKNLKELGFKKKEIEVYIALTELGESRASYIAKKVELPRTTVISILNNLKKDGYITTHKHKSTIYYWIESPKVIEERLKFKLSIAKELDELLVGLYRSEADFPYAKVYDTRTAIKKYIEKTIIRLNKNSTILTVDVPNSGNYDKIVTKDYGRILVDLKNKKGVITKTLIPNGLYKTINPEKITKQNIIIKEMPKEIEFTASIWIVENTLVLFSGKYPFIVAVNHKFITDSFRSIYNFLWNLSAPMN